MGVGLTDEVDVRLCLYNSEVPVPGGWAQNTTSRNFSDENVHYSQRDKYQWYMLCQLVIDYIQSLKDVSIYLNHSKISLKNKAADQEPKEFFYKAVPPMGFSQNIFTNETVYHPQVNEKTENGEDDSEHSAGVITQGLSNQSNESVTRPTETKKQLKSIEKVLAPINPSNILEYRTYTEKTLADEASNARFVQEDGPNYAPTTPAPSRLENKTADQQEEELSIRPMGAPLKNFIIDTKEPTLNPQVSDKSKDGEEDVQHSCQSITHGLPLPALTTKAKDQLKSDDKTLSEISPSVSVAVSNLKLGKIFKGHDSRNLGSQNTYMLINPNELYESELNHERGLAVPRDKKSDEVVPMEQEVFSEQDLKCSIELTIGKSNRDELTAATHNNSYNFQFKPELLVPSKTVKEFTNVQRPNNSPTLSLLLKLVNKNWATKTTKSGGVRELMKDDITPSKVSSDDNNLLLEGPPGELERLSSSVDLSQPDADKGFEQGSEVKEEDARSEADAENRIEADVKDTESEQLNSNREYFKKTTTKIDKSGTKIVVADCLLTIPKGAVEKEEELTIVVSSRTVDLPPGCFPFTKALKCSPPIEFLKQVTVRMITPFSFPKERKTIGDIKYSNGKEWKSMADVVLAGDNYVEFNINHFSSYAVVAHGDFFDGATEFDLFNVVYWRSTDNCIIIVLSMYKTNLDEAMRHLDKKKTNCHMVMDPDYFKVPVREGQTLHFILNVKNLQDVNYIPFETGGDEIEVNSNLLDKVKKLCFKAYFKPEQREKLNKFNGSLEIDYFVRVDGHDVLKAPLAPEIRRPAKEAIRGRKRKSQNEVVVTQYYAGRRGKINAVNKHTKTKIVGLHGVSSSDECDVSSSDDSTVTDADMSEVEE